MVKQKKSKEESSAPPAKTSDFKSRPTPEQMRVAQILEKKIIDPLVKLKLKQIMDATQRSADDVYVALHDSDFDADQAVHLLMEGKTQDDWCLSKNKKKKIQESKEKKTEERLVVEQNGDTMKSANNSFGRKNDDRGKPGRDRGPRNGERRPRGPGDDQQSTVRGRGFRGGRGPRTPRIPPGTMVFERSSNQETVQLDESPHIAGVKAPLRNQWEKPLINNSVDEDWDNEEFTGSLSHTQIFTSSLKSDAKVAGVEENDSAKVVATELHNEVIPEHLPMKVSLPAQQPTVIPAVALAKQDSPQRLVNRTYASLTSEAFNPAISTSLFTQAKETPQEPQPSQMPPARISLPPESKSDFLSRLTFPKNSSDHPIVSARKPPPSKIPTSAVEMPPEAMPSLSLLDIEFGAIDLGPSATDSESNDSFSVGISQSPSNTGLILSSNVAPSSGSSFSRSTSNPSSNSVSTSSSSFLLSDAITSITNLEKQDVQPAASASSLHYQPSSNQMFPVVTTTSSLQNFSGLNSHHLMSQNSYSSSSSSLGLMGPPNTIPSSSVNHVTLGHVVVPAPAHLTSVAPNHLGSSQNHLGSAQQQQSHLMNSSVSPQPTQSMGRYMSSSNQPAYNTHLQYGYMSSQYDNRPMQTHLQQHETNTSLPPPHMSQPPPLPPAFKHTPPGIPKGNGSANGPPMVANLPPPMVNPSHHQYIGNMPYYPHQPFFYYEEMPQVLNNQQQRLHHHMAAQGYDTSNYHHQTSNKDGVHYNV